MRTVSLYDFLHLSLVEGAMHALIPLRMSEDKPLFSTPTSAPWAESSWNLLPFDGPGMLAADSAPAEMRFQSGRIWIPHL